jgi:hypothetical protein
MKTAIIDIGELGWSLYLSGHALWLKSQGKAVYALTFKDRFGLYVDRVEQVIEVSCLLSDQFKGYSQDGSGFRGLSDEFVWNTCKRFLPEPCTRDYKFGCDWSIRQKAIFQPYVSTLEKYNGRMRILVFPRYRNEVGYSFRNLSKEFYLELCKMLCEEYPDKLITVVGSAQGAYGFDGFRASNFENLVGRTNIQDVINLCACSVAAIGGTSAPPKISLLQGVPTFIIGHERKRFVEDENWNRTRVGFYDILVDKYQDFDNKDCLSKIKEFIDVPVH